MHQDREPDRPRSKRVDLRVCIPRLQHCIDVRVVPVDGTPFYCDVFLIRHSDGQQQVRVNGVVYEGAGWMAASLSQDEVQAIYDALLRTEARLSGAERGTEPRVLAGRMGGQLGKNA